MSHEDNYIEDPPKWLLDSKKLITKSLPTVRLVLLGYVGVSIFTDVDHVLLSVVELILLSYFLLELLILYRLYECRVEFLHDKWAHILFFIPLFSAFRLIGIQSHAVRFAFPSMDMLRNLRLARKSGHGVIDYHNIHDTFDRVKNEYILEYKTNIPSLLPTGMKISRDGESND